MQVKGFGCIFVKPLWRTLFNYVHYLSTFINDHYLVKNSILLFIGRLLLLSKTDLVQYILLALVARSRARYSE
jgi:hypothetical protein